MINNQIRRGLLINCPSTYRQTFNRKKPWTTSSSKGVIILCKSFPTWIALSTNSECVGETFLIKTFNIMQHTKRIPSSHVWNNNSWRRKHNNLYPTSHLHNYRKCIVFLMRRIACSRSPLSHAFDFPCRAPQKCVWERRRHFSLKLRVSVEFTFLGLAFRVLEHRAVCACAYLLGSLSAGLCAADVSIGWPQNPTQPTERDYILLATTIQSVYLIYHGVRLLLGPNYKLCRSAHFFLRPLFLVGSHYVEVLMENINGDLEGGRHEDLIILVNWDSSNPFRNRTYRLTRVFFF